MLSDKLNIGDKYKLFSYGLCHDIGFAVVNACFPDEVEKIYQTMQKGIHQIVAERIVLGGVTHAEVGGWICKKWGIPEDIGLVAEYHHSPLNSKENTDEMKLIHLADSISTEYYEMLLGFQMSHPIQSQVMEDLHVTREMLEDIGKELPAEIEKVSKIFALPTK